MNFFESDILKGKYFPKNSRERLQATMVNLFVLVGVFIILLYAYENFIYENYLMLAVEMTIFFILTIAYLIFPHYVSIKTTSYMILASLTFLISISLVIPDKDPELSLFWLAALPAFVFYFLGVKNGIRWSRNMFLILLFIPLVSLVSGMVFVYEWQLLSQIILGYLVVSYLLYMIEKERFSYEKRLNIALKENKMLFLEVHHRTKNNMQIMMGLLETQAFKIDNPKYKKMFESHVDRLKAMSLMHKNLYTNQSYEEVNLKNYLSEIAKNLQLYSVHKIFLDIQPIRLDMKIAMNIGLIFNEVVTNAIEHAFSHNKKGTINVVFTQLENKKYFLLFRDNGKGFKSKKSYNSLGMTLIDDLSRGLPHGTIEVNGTEGTEIKILFGAE